MKTIKKITFIIFLLMLVSCSNNDNDEPTPNTPKTGYFPIKIAINIPGATQISICTINYNLNNEIVKIVYSSDRNPDPYDTYDITYTNNLVTQIENTYHTSSINEYFFSYTEMGVLNSLTLDNGDIYPIDYNPKLNMYSASLKDYNYSFYFDKDNVPTQSFIDGGLSRSLTHNSKIAGPFKNISFQPSFYLLNSFLMDFYFFSPVEINNVDFPNYRNLMVVNEYDSNNNLSKSTYINSNTNEVYRECTYEYQLREMN